MIACWASIDQNVPMSNRSIGGHCSIGVHMNTEGQICT